MSLFYATLLDLNRQKSAESARQIKVLLHCVENGGSGVRQISDATGISVADVAQSLSKLSARGLLTEDGRVNVAALTPAGWELVQQSEIIWRLIVAVVCGVVSGLLLAGLFYAAGSIVMGH